ncbi:MAG TPA: glycosyltransferase family 2 protein [Candidatus Methanoperedens sp.]|nr:glycosyltransferase [Candidatus Methanoperedens sp.]HLB71672.1 glycosyltransferase family 2 protein [Candidatus Methanoperedens sp.]
MQLFNIGVAYGLSEMILSLVVKKKNLPKANKIISFPSVALLYVTYNDVMPELLFKLKDQTYKNYDIFVLDDSTKEKCIEIIDNCGLSVVRRGNRTGFKAGSLNNWLILYGNKYDYFIIADSDSAFEKDFIENIVKYAEHPLNKNIAIFQSKILPWNDKNSFPRIVGAMAPLAIYFNEKLGNECSTIISWGHNNLHRTGIIVAEGGFDENFVSEDFATCLNLIKKGYECKMVDVLSYEAIPETVQNYSKRYIRWAKQNLQLLKLDTREILFTTRLHLFMGIYMYTIWAIIFIGILIAVWGYSSSINDIIILFKFIVSGEIINTPFLQPFLLIIFYILNITLLRLPLSLKLGISMKDYFKNLLLNIAISSYLMFPLLKAELGTITNAKITFEVTKKGEKPSSIFQIIKEMRMSILFNIIILIGLINNPVFFFFNFVWLIPFLASPLIIYSFSENRHKM